jgi:hypothetical protein
MLTTSVCQTSCLTPLVQCPSFCILELNTFEAGDAECWVMILGSHDGSGQATRPVSLAMVTLLRAGVEAEVVGELVFEAMYTAVLTDDRCRRSRALVELKIAASCSSG